MTDRAAADLDVQIAATLSEPITPAPWDSSVDEIGVPWWTARAGSGTTLAGFVGVGIIVLDLVDGITHVGWAVADPRGPGATERRAWIQAAIRLLVGEAAIRVDAGRVSRWRGEA